LGLAAIGVAKSLGINEEHLYIFSAPSCTMSQCQWGSLHTAHPAHRTSSRRRGAVAPVAPGGTRSARATWDHDPLDHPRTVNQPLGQWPAKEPCTKASGWRRNLNFRLGFINHPAIGISHLWNRQYIPTKFFCYLTIRIHANKVCTWLAFLRTCH
jgi:hypothetical protein